MKKSKETKVVNADTGAVKGQKLARFDLIPPIALWAVAERFGAGAEKYTIDTPVSLLEAKQKLVLLCSCQNNIDQLNVTPKDDTLQKDFVSTVTINNTLQPKEQNVTQTELNTVKDYAELATIDGLRNKTLIMRLIRNLFKKLGLTKIDSIKTNSTENTKNNHETKNEEQKIIESGFLQDSILHTKTTPQSPSANVVESKTKTSEEDLTLTTTIKQASSEASFVDDAIRESDSWETIQKELKKHSATCKAQTHLDLRKTSTGSIVIHTEGARNWELGYEWSLNFAALNRHLWAFWGGEDIDEETGAPHLDAVIWHAMVLRTFMETHPEMDDRPNATSN